jgi:hypothetical protein
MKRNLIILVLALLAIACGQVYYTTPQPAKGRVVRSFIPSVQGVYVDSAMDIGIFKDYLVVSGDTFRLTSKTPIEGEALVKFYKNFYFISFADSIFFTVYMANFYENKLAIYTLNADERSIGILEKFVRVETIDKEDEHYLINPSKKEFDLMIENELFDVLGVYEKK